MTRIRSLLLLAALASGCGSSDDPGPWSPVAPRRAPDRYGGPIHEPDLAAESWRDGHDLRSLRLSMILDPAAAGFSIQSTLAVRRSPGAAPRFGCRLDPPARVERVLVGGVEASFAHEGTTLSVDLPEASLAAEDLEVLVFASCPVPGPAGLLAPCRAWHPRRGPGDPFLGEVSVLASPGVDVIASGLELEARPAASGWVERRFLLDAPARAMWVAWGAARTGPVVRSGVSVVGIGVTGERLAEFADDLDRLSSIFGSPPARTVALVEASLGGPAGASAPGLVAIDPSRAARPSGRHLLAHQWWDRADSEADELLCRAAEVACGESSPGGDDLVERIAEGRRDLGPALERYRAGNRSLDSLREALSGR